MAAKRCSSCSINFPTTTDRCPKCGGSIWWNSEANPDADWQEHAQAGPESASSIERLAQLYTHPADARVPVHVRNGRAFLTHDHLIGVGYLNLEPGSIVFVNDRFFELNGHNKKTREWWVEEIIPDNEFKGLPERRKSRRG
jgi:hypothetical protein